MQPPYSTTPDLDPPMSRLTFRSRWTPDTSPPSSWQPSSALPLSHTISPSTSNPRTPHLPYSIRLSPSSDSSLTDHDISRRNLAASGLDVFAPEFVPSFAVPNPRSPQPPDNPPPPFSSHLYESAYNSTQRFQPSLSATTSLYDQSPSQPPPFYTHTQSHSQPHLIPSLSTFYQDESSYSAANSADFSSPLFSHSPPSVVTTRPAHLDESTYVTAVQHFDEEFPALRTTPESNNHAPSPPLNSRWSTHSPNLTSKTAISPDHYHRMFPKALGWDALQKEHAHKQRQEHAAREWQNTLEQFKSEMEFEEICDDLIEETNLSDDIGLRWVTTGKSVGHLYQSLRADAAEEARLRNKYFDRAAAAFKRNDGASAKRLGTLGREANERMKELHRKAADAIFEARNPVHVTDVLDLHGLHVSEALERLPAAFERAPVGTLRVLTGTGHHTKGTGRARLRPAVKKWLQDNGYFFEEVIDANEYVGGFKVEISG